MSLTIEIASRRDFKAVDLWAMHRLRAKVFAGRMGWTLPLIGGMEIDGYDAIDPFYMMMREPGGALRGCWRLLPTEGPYMLRDSFPQLLHGAPAPAHPKIWELSRFALETEGRPVFGFSRAVMQSIDEVIAYGRHAGLEQYVTVTTTAIERMLRKAGVATSRFGPPLPIGAADALAIHVHVDESFRALRARRRS